MDSIAKDPIILENLIYQMQDIFARMQELGINYKCLDFFDTQLPKACFISAEDYNLLRLTSSHLYRFNTESKLRWSESLQKDLVWCYVIDNRA